MLYYTGVNPQVSEQRGPMGVDRHAVVARHAVALAALDPRSPLQVGNGELAIGLDVTGFQSLPGAYPVPDPSGTSTGTLLGTLSQWGWHSTPRPDGAELDASRRTYRTRRGDVPYVDGEPMTGADDSAMGEGATWLRANPHRLDLARIGLVALGPGGVRGATAALVPDQVTDVDQRLDLWTGVVRSAVTVDGTRLEVSTACHPDLDAVAWRVAAPDGGADRLAVRLAFPHGSQLWADGADWDRPDAHASVLRAEPGGVVVDRFFDGAGEPTYRVVVRVAEGTPVVQAGAHEVLVPCADGGLELVVAFVPVGRRATTAPGAPGLVPEDLPDAAGVLAASEAHWPAFWSRGAAVDLAGTPDPRAHELERRAVLSQYLTAVNCAGSLPPQETGLLVNSWRGRFHLEMHLWHAAHFALWGRPDLLERSMGFYLRALPAARATAALQGYDGARWPKQVGPDARESPSHIGPFLLWQQPHPIHLAELLRRAAVAGGASDAVGQRYAEVVDATARFMAAVAEPGDDGHYHLGPPLVPAQESYADLRGRACDPPFELASWHWALGVAQEWRERAGLPREPLWDDVRAGLVPPPVRNGLLAAIGAEPWTVRDDHPSLVYGLGVVPATGYLDPALVAATLDDVLADWDWDSTWGWDYPALAMTAARLGRREQAVDLLLMPTAKNEHLPDGHNRQTASLPAYLPGNGGLLWALALMVAGWDGATGDPRAAAAPGLPPDWLVRSEGFARAP